MHTNAGRMVIYWLDCLVIGSIHAHEQGYVEMTGSVPNGWMKFVYSNHRLDDSHCIRVFKLHPNSSMKRLLHVSHPESAEAQFTLMYTYAIAATPLILAIDAARRWGNVPLSKRCADRSGLTSVVVGEVAAQS